MKFILTFALLFISLVVNGAQNPSFKAFRGTNGVNVLSNSTTDQIIIGPSTPISTTASNAAMSLMVWTNDSGVIHTIDSAVRLQQLFNFTNASASPAVELDAELSGSDDMNAALKVTVADSDRDFTGNRNSAIYGFNKVTNSATGLLYNNGGSLALYGDYFGDDPSIGQGVGVYAAADSASRLQYAFAGQTTAQGDDVTSVGLAVTSGNDGFLNSTNVAGYFETMLASSGDDPIFIPSVLLLDNRDTGHPLIVARTNNGTTQFSLQSNGEIYSAGGMATNAAAFNFITTNLLSGQTYTNFAQRGHVVATVAMTNILAGDVSSMSLIVDQDGDGTWDTTNGPVRINGVALSAGSEQLFGLLQPGARFAFTNQSAGVTPSVSIVAGSCQWSRW